MKCKDKIYFCYLANEMIPEAAPGQRHASGNAALRSSVLARGLPGLLFSPMYQGFTRYTTVLWSFPQQGRNLKHVRQGASESVTGPCCLNTHVLLVKHTRPNNN